MQKYSPTTRNSNYIRVEDIEVNAENKFVSDCATPYFRDIYRDLSQRTLGVKSLTENRLSLQTFQQYVCLPSILCERLFRIFQEDGNQESEFISEEGFIKNLIRVFISDLESKMNFTFNIYDLNEDGFISKEDVKFILTHILISQGCEKNSNFSISPISENSIFGQLINSKLKQSQESQDPYFDERKYTQRRNIIDQMTSFVDKVFQAKQSMSFEEYSDFNTNQSSYLLFTILQTLHQNLPCASNFFKLKRAYFQNCSLNGSNENSETQSVVIVSPTLLNEQTPIVKIQSLKKGLYQTTSLNNIKTKIILKKSKLTINSEATYDINIKNDDDDTRSCSSIGSFNINPSPCRTPQKLSFHRRKIAGSSMINASIIPPRSSSQLRNMNEDLSILPTIGAKRVTRLKVGHHHHVSSVQMSPVAKKESIAPLPEIKKNNSLSIQASTPQNSKSKFFKQFQAIQQPTSMISNAIVESVKPIQKKSKFNWKDAFKKQEQVIDNFSKDIQITQSYHEGDIVLKSRQGKLRKCWMALHGKELYLYKDQGDAQHQIMHCLEGTYVKAIENDNEIPAKFNLWQIQLILSPSKVRCLYFTTKQKQQNWLNAIEEAIGTRVLEENYDLGDLISGDAQKGISLATDMLTQQQVVVKHVMKNSLTSSQMLQLRRQIDILQMCEHKNIVKLIDVFETPDCIYLVSEHLEGKDLFNYWHDRNFQVTETRTQEIIKQLISALNYIHSLGVVHSDINFDHILMSSFSDQAIPKLSGFGFLDFIGHQTNKSPQLTGTLGYIAPEVIRGEPAIFASDLWSIGCICHALLSCSLPFDEEGEESTKDSTLNKPLLLTSNCWNNISGDAKDFIKKLLCKDSITRLSIDNALQHYWLMN